MKAELVKREDHWALYNEDGHKIAATIDGCNSKLSIKNCEAIENGYDLDELINKLDTPEGYDQYQYDSGIRKGFELGLELLGDKKFSEKDVRDAYYHGEQDSYMKGGLTKQKEDEYMQSLQQTEWEVFIEMEVINHGTGEDGKLIETVEPKLDEENCLILKRL